ncbi:uncharacterized protein DNG_06935 [Cephalotrichum gorgonifer]|uniref:SGNH hydrolase-type esterase domain-containing protein n=1 Tax=Cephalotrichum gorgonifer TaxID=2041049 RepID=A0AAE8N1J9_9PEZI|nr:uncharacterized protein DNG_06935 [Cephalotrichum gorgonifer]
MIPLLFPRSLSAGLLLLLGAADAAPIGGGVTLRILPLGDSLTYGSTTSPLSYRGPLASILEGGGNPVELVGTTLHGPAPHNAVEASSADQRLDELLARAAVAVPGFLPNIVLVNGGAADCAQDYEVETAGNRTREILDLSWRKSMYASVVLSTVLPRGGDAARACAAAVNEQLRALVREQQAVSRKVVLLDFDEGAGVEVDAEGFPTDAGYEAMGKRWFEGIKDAVGRGWVQKPEARPEDAPVPSEEEGGEGGGNAGGSETSPADPSRTDTAGPASTSVSPAGGPDPNVPAAAPGSAEADELEERGVGGGGDAEGGAPVRGLGVAGVIGLFVAGAVGFVLV